MTRLTLVSTLATLALGAVSAGCKTGGVGDPCIPNTEFSPDDNGTSETGVLIDDRSFQCETRMCLADFFRGRVTCPWGNTTKDEQSGKSAWQFPGTASQCVVPGTNSYVRVPVLPQCANNPAIDMKSGNPKAVYCTRKCETTEECQPGGETAWVCEVPQKGLDPNLTPKGKYCLRKDRPRQSEGCTGCDDDPSKCGFKTNKWP
jgi:hypothetical protein